MNHLTRGSALIALLVALCAAPLADARMSDEQWKVAKANFQQQWADPAKRSAAILALGECDHPEAVELLIKMLGARDSATRRLAAERDKVLRELDEHVQFVVEANRKKRTFSVSEANRLNAKHAELEKRLAKLDQQMTASNFVRFSAIRALAKTRDAEALELIHEACGDRKWEVATGAIQAMARCGDKAGAAKHVRPEIDDRDPKVATAAIDTCAALGDTGAIDAIIGQLKGKTWQVRLAAANALATLNGDESVRPLLKAVGPLVDALQDEEGRLREDFDAALKAITGYTFGGEPQAWKAWYGGVKDNLAAVVKQRQKTNREQERKGGTVSFYGIQTQSKRLCFVIDISGSMQQKASKPAQPGQKADPTLTGGWGDGAKDPDYPVNGTKMDVANHELKRAVKALPDDAQFNIVYFSTLVNVYSPKKLVKATSSNKKKTLAWIEHTLKPTLMTNIFDALERALELHGPKIDRNYDKGIDTIFFLTDGQPTHGRIRESDKMLEEIRARNRTRKIKIHVIGIGSDAEIDTEFLRKLAEENGGTFVHRK